VLVTGLGAGVAVLGLDATATGAGGAAVGNGAVPAPSEAVGATGSVPPPHADKPATLKLDNDKLAPLFSKRRRVFEC
jgi:hypothetical protein